MDPRAAFDSVDRDAIWSLLRAHGMPQEIVDLMKLLYSDTMSAARMDWLTFEWFRVDRGVSQKHLGVNIGTECFTDLDYADDVALLAESCSDVVESLGSMSQEVSNSHLRSTDHREKCNLRNFS